MSNTACFITCHNVNPSGALGDTVQFPARPEEFPSRSSECARQAARHFDDLHLPTAEPEARIIRVSCAPWFGHQRFRVWSVLALEYRAEELPWDRNG